MLERIRAGYLWEAKQRGFPVVYAIDDAEAVFKQVWQHVAQTLASRDGSGRPSSPTSVAEVLADRGVVTQASPVEPPITSLSSASQSPLPAKEAETKTSTDKTVTIELGKASQLLVQRLLVSNVGVLQTSEPSIDNLAFPEGLSDELKATWLKRTKDLQNQYKALEAALAEYLKNDTSDQTVKAKNNKLRIAESLRPLLPNATTSNITITAAPEVLAQLSKQLAGDLLPEAQKAGVTIAQKLREISTSFSHGTDTPGEYSAVFTKWSQDYLPANHTSGIQDVNLVSYFPRNELELIPNILYAFSNLPLGDLRNELFAWPYDRKEAVLKEYLSRKPLQSIADAVVYEWELLCSHVTFKDLQKQLTFSALAFQTSSPRYGYDTPKLIEEAGLADSFDDCFDLSLKLFSELQGGAQFTIAAYGTLQGHKVRWSASCSLVEISRALAAAPNSVETRDLLLQMLSHLAEAHPVIAENITTAAK
jgi:hypothetical protein